MGYVIEDFNLERCPLTDFEFLLSLLFLMKLLRLLASLTICKTDQVFKLIKTKIA